MTGHIKLDRKIMAWEWYADSNTFRVFIHLLLMATYKDGTWKGLAIKRGQVVTGRQKLAKALRLTEQQIRTSISTLKRTNEITIKTTNKFSIITICKYDTYQSFENQNNQQNNQQSSQQNNQQIPTFNKINNINNNKADGVPPPAPPVFGLRVLGNGESYIEGTKFFYKEDFNELPSDNVSVIVLFFKTTKHIEITSQQVQSLWEVFKIQELTEQKLYKNEADVFKHFFNWSKKQSFLKPKKERASFSSKTVDEKIDKPISNLKNLSNRYD